VVRNINRREATPRAVLFVGDRSYRVDLQDPIGAIPDWVLWQCTDYKHCSVQEYVANQSEVLQPRFDLVLWEESSKEYVREHAIVVLTALQGSDVYISRRLKHYDQGTTVVSNLSYDQMVARTTDISRRNLRRKLRRGNP
jgi:hypothetical protein